MAFNPKSLENLVPRKIGDKKSLTGRNLCLVTLDNMLKAAGNQELLYTSLEEKFKADPATFLLKYVYPLYPKNGAFEFLGTVKTETSDTLSKVVGKMNEEQRKMLFSLFEQVESNNELDG